MQVRSEMKSLKQHFLVAKLQPSKEGVQQTMQRRITNPLVDTRREFLWHFQKHHWQFDKLKFAQHSTLNLLYHLHTHTKVDSVAEDECM